MDEDLPQPVADCFEAADWSRYLTAQLERAVEVRFGRARRQVLVYKPGQRAGDADQLRMNAFFREAPEPIRHAVWRWLAVGRRARKASAELDAWIAERSRELPPRKLTQAVPKGDFYDLEQLVGEVLGHIPELAGVELPDLSWGRRGSRSVRKSLQLGSYDSDGKRVRVHPVLDQEAVPIWFVRFVLYHELLHAGLPIERSRTGRVLHHGPGFRSREADYPDAARAQVWEKENLPKLLRSARTGKAIKVPRRFGWLFG